MWKCKWAGAAWIVALSTGCAFEDSTGREDLDGTTPVPADAGADADQHPSATPALGTLIEAQAQDARPRVCVSFDAEGVVSSMDEFECETAYLIHECAPDDCPWVHCGGCLLYVNEPEDGELTLWARPDGTECHVFAGTYAVTKALACRSAEPTCPDPSARDCGR